MTKILLVEDDKSLREIYGVRLLAEGYDIVSAGDGEEALAMAIKEKPLLIISDVMMPKISGFDMLDILRSTTETRNIKVIMMTALSSEDQRARGEQLGADRYLVKSQVGIEDVVRTVHEVLGDAGGAAAAAAPATPAAPTPDVPDVPEVPAEPVAAAQPTPEVAPVAEVAPVETPDVAPLSSGDPGPMPPQPTEIEPLEPVVSTLPQPTAPFSSPRPANLGIPAVDPAAAPVADTAAVADDSTATPLSPEESSQLSQELTATAEPTPSVDPLSDPTASAGVSPIAGPESAPAAPTLDPYGQPAQEPAPVAEQTTASPEVAGVADTTPPAAPTL